MLGTPGRVTIRDVAATAGVSRQTVSNALIHPERVKAPTLEKVRAVIDELGYRPSNAAQTLRSQRTGAVGFELNATGAAAHNAVAFPFAVALSALAPEHGSHIVTFGSLDPRPLLSGYEDMVSRQLVDAFILADTHPEDPRPAWLQEAGVPFAAFGRMWGREELTSWADVDGRSGVRDATAHLIGAGYPVVGFLGWPGGSSVGDDRRAGWEAAHREAGLACGPVAACHQDLQEATKAARGLLDQAGRGAAIVCVSDLLALGVERAATERGWRLGTDIGLTGFDNSSMAVLSGISSVAQPLDDIADILLEFVHQALSGGAPPEFGELVNPQFIERASSSPVPTRSR